MKLQSLFLSAALVLGLNTHVQAAEPVSVDSLLNLVKQGQARDDKEFKQRLARFNQSKAEQEKMVADAQNERTRLEQLSAQKEKEFQQNETAVAEAQERLNNRLGSLKELFGVLQQVAGDTKAVFEGSVISSELPGREQFLTDLIKTAGSSSKLPSIEELERLWFEMQREMTYSGRVSTYNAQVVLPSGNTTEEQVIRVGGFNVVSADKYLNWDLEAGRLVELDKQPGSRYTDPAAELASVTGAELTGFWIDPSRGQLLKIMGQSPELGDRVDQGGVVGYIIIVLGAIGIALALWRMVVLYSEAGKIRAQMDNDTPNENNALGRVMAVFNANKNADTETLELHLGEAIAAEIPRLTRAIGWIKIISVVAPLLGLLGTVTGMIDVFETMSLFGTGDPKLMAGGISQALVTTVLGLVAAIPCVFLHTLTNNRSRELMMILEERATGILARQSEQQTKPQATAA
ncbi:MotA/TolQ/ExbB proton channel family protein [Thalassolituus alkanivorans]|uniref:MotA/TolQ/ExbB proton channel family protein n=1 Tax=Thalassolituus alkanivorans TaxID=2881055 RepID=UPI001E4A91FA|nr:MotA/TolQ/ExbB proton channel family protein [Thalassolituus alkanivorans]MCB2386718.1 MotA/TolQ/ExbB proton channel family protein [Thalassolituus alkanivorans]MCB2422893.1 MotA/TolQ/ExbB proton channel family protein [Thalassolituus alkanivorans]